VIFWLAQNIFVAFAAKLASATGPKDPRHPDAIANEQLANVRSGFHNASSHLVAGDQRLFDN
jgi:hypothetical protein